MTYGIIATRVRRWLGLERLESNMLTLDGMASGAASKADLLVSEINANRTRVNEAHNIATGADRRQTSLRREVENMGIEMRTMRDALGGVWKTASGYTVPIFALSDTHLQAILDGDFGGYETQRLVKREQARRTEDDSWATRQGPGSMRQRILALEMLATVPQDSPVGRDRARAIFRKQPACQASIERVGPTGRAYRGPAVQPRGQEYERECNVVLDCDYEKLERRTLRQQLQQKKREVMAEMREVNDKLRELRRETRGY